MSNKKETAAGAAPKPKPKAAAKGPVMYVGPTIPGIGIQNQVFTEIPASAQEAFKKEPELGNLFISIKDYPEANVMLREKRGYIHSAFNKALELKNGGKK
ncbi:hypothetical protein D3Z47_11645 [Lachnospiraceae bacterium]|nr:hypothetical protein [Lachnospiraceae bacterium]